MKKFYFTFGQIHTHSVNGVTFDKDIVVEISALSYDNAREIMVAIFGLKWAFQYDKKPDMSFFPRGIYKLA